GYLGVSAGVQLTPPIDGIAEINAEIDVMNWREGNLLSASAVTEMLIEQLRSRRSGKVPIERPIGILTHHLVFDDEAIESIAGLWRFLRSHPATDIVMPDTLFRCDSPAADRQTRRWDSERHAGITVVITSCGRQELLAR